LVDHIRVSSTNKTDHLDIAEILLKVVLNSITLTLYEFICMVAIAKPDIDPSIHVMTPHWLTT
jgi:hypothetical protein